jgi:hypothetical protein
MRAWRGAGLGEARLPSEIGQDIGNHLFIVDGIHRTGLPRMPLHSVCMHPLDELSR